MIKYNRILDKKIYNCFLLQFDTKDIIKDLKNLEDLFDFSTLNENHELSSSKNKRDW